MIFDVMVGILFVATLAVVLSTVSYIIRPRGDLEYKILVAGLIALISVWCGVDV